MSPTVPPSLILASASPRRRELLGRLGLNPRIVPADIDESVLPGELAHDYVLRVAHDKAHAVRALPGNNPPERAPNIRGVVLASDTAVVLGAGTDAERILGKPADGSEALRMLEELSGRTHEVLTSVVLLDPDGIEHSALARARVQIAPTDRRQREWYVATGEPLDCAGSYALQGIGAFMVERLEGDPTTVIGLPLSVTVELLAAAGLHWPPR